LDHIDLDTAKTAAELPEFVVGRLLDSARLRDFVAQRFSPAPAMLHDEHMDTLRPIPPANLTPSVSHVSREERHARNGHKGAVMWFTGLSGSGKSTLATALERELVNRGWQTFVLDGDNIRLGLSSDLGFSVEDRAENIRRVAEVAKLLAEAGVITIAAFISPYRSDRQRAREIMARGGSHIPFSEIYLSTPLAVCEQRDPKHLYVRARAGEIKDFTGVSSPFEAPERPELVIDTSEVTPGAAITMLVEHLEPRVVLPSPR
jgi:bifunctional enzyme CysN/CysC